MQRDVGLGPVDVGPDDPADDLVDRPLEGDHGGQLLGQRGDDVGPDRGVQVGAVGEVPVDHRAVEPGALRDLLHVELRPHGLGLDDLEGRVEDAQASLLVVGVPARLTAVLSHLTASPSPLEPPSEPCDRRVAAPRG